MKGVTVGDDYLMLNVIVVLVVVMEFHLQVVIFLIHIRK